MRDLAQLIHKGIYGKSDKANSPENQTEEFQRGFKFAMDNDEMESDQMIMQGWLMFGRLGYETSEFREWKRGMWAARMQRTISNTSNDAL